MAEALARRLESLGPTVFIDIDPEAIRGGDDLPQRIVGAIQDASITVPLFSRQYFSDGADWTLRELDTMIELQTQIVPVLCDMAPRDLPPRYSYFAQRNCLELSKMGMDDVAREIVRLVDERNREITEYDLPLLARAAAAAVATDPQTALMAIGVPYVLPSEATATDRWYLALRIAGTRRRTLLRSASNPWNPYDPRVRFLANSVRAAVHADEMFPGRAAVESELARFGVGLRRDNLMEALHAEALHAVAPAFAEQLGVVRAVQLDDRLNGVSDPKFVFDAAASALLARGASPARLVAHASSDVHLALLTTVVRWVENAAEELSVELLDDLSASFDDEPKTGVFRRFEHQRRRLRILSDADRDVSAVVDAIVERALEADMAPMLPRLLEAANERRLSVYAKPIGAGTGRSVADALLWSVRRLVECGADAAQLPDDLAIAVSAAVFNAPDARVGEVAKDSSVQRLWLKIVGPDLTEAQRTIVNDLAGRAPGMPSPAVRNDAAKVLARATGDRIHQR